LVGSFIGGEQTVNAQSHARAVILCLDDQATALELEIRKRLLETAGYAVLATTRPHEALKMFRDNRVNFVLAEQISSRLGGSFTLAAMKRLKPDLPIAIYSADWEPSPEHMRFADVWVSKLVSANEFFRAIENLLAKTPPAAVA
jgi:DNA-binding NtrC family response regulator